MPFKYPKKRAEYQKEYNKEYYAKNKQKIAEYKKEYYAKNKQKILEREREYRAKNKQKLKDYRKEHYVKNKQKIGEQVKEYRAKNKQKIAKYVKRVYELRKRGGLCVECGNSAYPGYTKCQKHILIANKRSKIYYAKNIQKRIKYAKRVYELRKRNGLCVRCGRGLDEYSINGGLVTCQNCREGLVGENVELTRGRQGK
ncbi:unnamed protein product [marine sediment metagenome]|uniref:Uncharacterized protein n=1 Tax=marine sediment metagenome TaxID=412755 RepID=X1DDB9_9ZZZZ